MGRSRCYGGIGVGHTREVEKIKEKMNIAKEERAWAPRKRRDSLSKT